MSAGEIFTGEYVTLLQSILTKIEKNWNEINELNEIPKKKKIVLFFGSQNQKLTETFAINNSAFTFSFQFKFCNIALCYKMKVPC